MAPDQHAAAMATGAQTAHSALPIVLACATCEVTWRDVSDAPCWFCGKPGTAAHPERLVLD